MAGSESFVSREASSLSSLAWSKILPKVADFVANRSVGEFEFVQHVIFRGAGGEIRPGQR
jgi:hypothetical protein